MLSMIPRPRRRARLMAPLLGIAALVLLLTATPASAATLTVTNTDDSGAGSLRQAMADAAPGDTIDFGVTGAITLTSGELLIDKDLTISGPGAGSLAIDGNASSRIFNVGSGVMASISGLTITNGNTTGNSGGIYNSSTSTLTLTNSTVSDNTTLTGVGGGIYNNGGTVTLTDSAVSDNTATGNGGGINIDSGGSATLTSSTVSGNSAGHLGGGIRHLGATLTNSTIIGNSADQGGGIYNQATLALTSSTVDGNLATNNGGGITNSSGSVTLTNSTVSGNMAFGVGGGIYAQGPLTLTSSTVSGNLANTTANSAVGGGGIWKSGGGTASLKNTIIAGNSAASGAPDCQGSPASLGYNLIGDDTGCSFTPTTGDLVGTGASPIDPLLDPLALNAPGTTETHALLSGSPAIDAIPLADCNDADGNPVATDQRGVARPVGAACDIGAFEGETEPILAIPGLTHWALLVVAALMTVTLLWGLRRASRTAAA